MPTPVYFPFRSSFYFLTLRTGSYLVVSGDGVLTTTRLVLVLTDVQMFNKEHSFINMDLCQSKIRYSVLFGLDIMACILLVAGILISSRRQPWPVLMVPWLVMFLCCTWLYYPNVMYHHKRPGPITVCVIIMGVCLYCWSVVLSYFLEVLERASLKPPHLQISDESTKDEMT